MPAMDPKQELNALASLSPMLVPAVHSRAAAAPVMIFCICICILYFHFVNMILVGDVCTPELRRLLGSMVIVLNVDGGDSR